MTSKKCATSAQTPAKAQQQLEQALSTVEMKQSTHESFVRDDKDSPGSDRTFGLVMAAALGVLGLFNGWHHGRLWPWLLPVAALFLVAAWLKPALLNPLNRLWMKLGLLLHRVVNPIVMGLLFYGTIFPTGLVMRLRGRDLLRLRRDPAAETYW